MRRAVVVIPLLCFAVLSVPQTPKEKRIAVKNGALKTAPPNKNENEQQDAATTPNQTIAIYNQPNPTEHNGDNKQGKDAIDVERDLAKFTLCLVIVGFLQLAALAVQAVLFFQQKKIMGQHKVSLEQLATAASDNAIAAKKSADALINSERSWVIPELEFLTDRGTVVVDYTGSKTLADLKVTCANCGNSPAWITEIDVRMEIGSIPRTDPDFTPEGHEISLQYEPIAPNGRSFELPLRQVVAEGDVAGKNYAFIHGIVKYRDAFTPNGKSFFGYTIQKDGLKYHLGRIRDAKYNDCK
jgi:hypothetical protein